VRRIWSRIPPLLRGLALIAVVAVIVLVLNLETTLSTAQALVSIAFFLAIAYFLFLVWRERRGDLEAWNDWNRKLFYAAIVLAVIVVGLAIGFGLPESRDALALILSLAACVYVVYRVWRLEHRY
jgi:purine-cytosine permease-like protein